MSHRLERKSFLSLSSVRDLLPFLQSCDQGAEGPHEKATNLQTIRPAPSDFNLSPAMTSALLGCQFRSKQELKLAVKNFFRSLGTNFCQEVFLKLISRYDNCIDVGVEYVEK
ncbi:hypothetical protein AVEN_188841-1 [Araneus ventricosus]|uniref:Mos1 transposase HTH domain-containing protein n=1 Tax=Araneus ventricosus TaxID=182803 RepID=A0A4Y2BSR2_ARAVE|nr:hypothetical protein AVEN_188841-1 [Araneus ventricosus]